MPSVPELDPAPWFGVCANRCKPVAYICLFVLQEMDRPNRAGLVFAGFMFLLLFCSKMVGILMAVACCCYPFIKHQGAFFWQKLSACAACGGANITSYGSYGLELVACKSLLHASSACSSSTASPHSCRYCSSTLLCFCEMLVRCL